jgi:hypothetical protein
LHYPNNRFENISVVFLLLFNSVDNKLFLGIKIGSVTVLRCAVTVFRYAVTLLRYAVTVLRCAVTVFRCAVTVLRYVMTVLLCAVTVLRCAVSVALCRSVNELLSVLSIFIDRVSQRNSYEQLKNFVIFFSRSG